MKKPLQVAFVYGTRPEAIKMAPIISAMRENDEMHPVVLVTGQHREMLDQVHKAFEVIPDEDLDIFEHGQPIDRILSRGLTALSDWLRVHRVDALVVQGDTTTTLAGALAGFYLGIPVVHVEAGLRTGDVTSPFPEESNRRITSQVASLHLAPTPRACRALEREGIPRGQIVVTGNSVIDALFSTLASGDHLPDAVRQHRGEHKLVSITLHRRESWGAPMQNVARAVAVVARERPDIRFVIPLHRNPRVREVVGPEVEGNENVLVTEPMEYPAFCALVAASTCVLTDSGGVQEEAPALGVPVLVARDTTERPEAIESGAAKLVGTGTEAVADELRGLLCSAPARERVSPYGDGRAAERSVAALEEMFGLGERLADFDPGIPVRTW